MIEIERARHDEALSQIIRTCMLSGQLITSTCRLCSPASAVDMVATAAATTAAKEGGEERLYVAPAKAEMGPATVMSERSIVEMREGQRPPRVTPAMVGSCEQQRKPAEEGTPNGG